MEIRVYKSDDLDRVMALYYESVHQIMVGDYSQAALDAMAPAEPNRYYWQNFLEKDYTLVAVEDDQIIGFGNVGQTGYIDLLYIDVDHLHRGVASNLVEELESYAKQQGCQRLNTLSTITSKGFFERRGYSVVNKQMTRRHNVGIVAYLMEKVL